MNRPTVKLISVLAVTIAALSFQQSSRAQTADQSVTIYQYRQVPADKVAEFVYRETTYWSKVAQKAVDAKKMTLWVLLEQVGGFDLPNSPNFLFVNTVPNVDALGDVFNAAAVFPQVPMESISTDGMSTTTSQFFLQDGNMVEAASTVRERDFKYVVMNYHNSSDAGQFIALENQYWMPFIKTAMDKKQTSQRGWANASVIAPQGENIKFNTVSYDFFSSLQAALRPGWSADIVFPTEGLDKLDKIRLNRMGTSIYRIVHVVSAK
jgi:hypothetical protein